MATSSGDLSEAEVNLTPLLDVVFVVLIIFMVVVPILELDKLTLAPGRSDRQEVHSVSANSPVTLHVRADNTIWLGKRQVGLERLDEALLAAHTTHPGATPQLFQDEKAHFGYYQRVKNALEAAGFATMDVILQPT